MKQDYVPWLLELRKKKQLHPTVEEKLIDVLKQVAPNFHPVQEPLGLAGGRNDLLLYESTGRKVLFEIFASASQVSRDLRILDKTKAECKIAVLIDKEADPSIADRFFKENPEDNYPYIFIGELFEEPPIECVLKLRQLIFKDEEALFQRILRAKLGMPDFLTRCREYGVDILSPEDERTENITFIEVFIAVLATKLRNLGVKEEPLLALLVWISDPKAFEFVIRKVSWGFNLFLYTDMGETKAVYSDRELLDWLYIGYQISKPHILLSLNALVYEVLDKYFVDTAESDLDRSIHFTIGISQMYQDDQGRQLEISLPRNTKKIHIYRPRPPMDAKQEEISPEQYLEMVEFS